MVMSLHCHAYAKNNSNSNAVDVLSHDDILPSQLHCIIIFCLVRQQQNAGSWNVRIYSVLPSPLLSKLKEVHVVVV